LRGVPVAEGGLQVTKLHHVLGLRYPVHNRRVIAPRSPPPCS
jgi:hypothetical protein